MKWRGYMEEERGRRHEMAPLQKRGKIVRPDSVDELVNTYEGDGRGVAWLPIGPIPFWSFC